MITEHNCIDICSPFTNNAPKKHEIIINLSSSHIFYPSLRSSFRDQIMRSSSPVHLHLSLWQFSPHSFEDVAAHLHIKHGQLVLELVLPLHDLVDHRFRCIFRTSDSNIRLLFEGGVQLYISILIVVYIQSNPPFHRHLPRFGDIGGPFRLPAASPIVVLVQVFIRNHHGDHPVGGCHHRTHALGHRVGTAAILKEG